MTEDLEALRKAVQNSKMEKQNYIMAQLTELNGVFEAIMDAKSTLQESLRSIKSIQIEAAQPILQDLSQFDQNCLQPYNIACISLKDTMRRDQANRQRSINSKIVKLLRTNIALPVCIRLVGHLKEQQKDSNGLTRSPLPIMFLQARETFFQESLLQLDPVAVLQSDPVAAFDRTIKLMKGPFVDIISQYYAIFEESFPLYDFVAKRMNWFFEMLEEIFKTSPAIPKLAPFWNQLVELNDDLYRYNCEFIDIVAPMIVAKAIKIICERFEKAVALFLGSVGRMTKIADASNMKAIPPFVLLCNVLDDAFRDAAQLPVPLLRDRLKGAIRTKLEPIEKCLREGGEKTQRLYLIFLNELLPYIDDHIDKFP